MYTLSAFLFIAFCECRYILAEVSGANLNPAVSIGLLVGKRICLERFIVYVIAQVKVTARRVYSLFLGEIHGQLANEHAP